MSMEHKTAPTPAACGDKHDAPGGQAPPIGPTYCIRRRDKPGRSTGAWEVIIHRDARIAAYRHFGDGKYGGYAAAFHAALAYRDEMLRKHPPVPRAVINQRLRVDNRSGYPGVTMVEKNGRLQGYVAETTLPCGTTLRCYFAVARHGKRAAFERAVAERQRQLQKVEGGAVRVAKSQRRKLPIPAPAPATEQDLVPRRKPTAPKRAPRPAYDPQREERIAQTILRRYGRTRPHQPGDPQLRGIVRYYRRDRRASACAGWQVLLYHRKRRLPTRIFMDRPHGGAMAAFEKACQARDALVRHYLPLLRNSGYTGVLPESSAPEPARDDVRPPGTPPQHPTASPDKRESPQWT